MTAWVTLSCLHRVTSSSIKDYVYSSGLAFGRFYNSLDGSWRHSYFAHLNITSESEYVSFVSADGKAIFYKLSEGVYVGDSGSGSLVRLEAGWEYRSPANTVYQFDLAGRLTSVTEAGSIQYTLAYAGLRWSGGESHCIKWSSIDVYGGRKTSAFEFQL
ncbi:hypothetical protein PSE10C_53940 [Pseudomonas amygdali pv. eriobotryae]|uniref:Uncharacterized protein n=1 Tax=Pseudomonas amygdali pv. eriobotryae TaxID=129137 RepID=A0A9P3EEC7_PSEA0|nr:hypothetical protein PSE10A_41960 [Pseudomonas amygdali pv. eriobotryae]GFZ74652.1 hypothetical protein PSE10C_53940 [Pseudomonas amygdali pv. eriobotryae]